MTEIRFVHLERLSGEYDDAIWAMLVEADEDFVPSLSARQDTTQRDFDTSATDVGGPERYFETLKGQSFIVAIDSKGNAIGFLSYIPDHELALDGTRICCDYISTVIVTHRCRNLGITKRMYQELFTVRAGRNFATRTWSTNFSHLHILEKLGFGLELREVGNRGENIDTVYYVKRSENE